MADFYNSGIFQAYSFAEKKYDQSKNFKRAIRKQKWR